MEQLCGEYRTYSDRVDTHAHAFGQLILPIAGKLHIEASDVPAVVDRTRLLYLPPSCQHTFFAQDCNQFLVLDIPSALLGSAGLVAGCKGLLQPMDDRWQALRSLLMAELNAPSASGLRHLVHYAGELLQTFPVPPSVRYIHAHLDQPLPLETLAALEGYSAPHFCSWFKRAIGQAPGAYIQQARLEKAKELLAHTDLNILEIAQAVGYEHAPSLTRLFRQKAGVTPSQYRQASRQA